MRRFVRFLAGLAGAGVLALVLVLVTILLLRGFDERDKMAIRPWHRVVPAAELRAAEMDASFTLAKYLAREEVLFREVMERVAPADRYAANRFWLDSPLCPSNLPRDWNRTFEMLPEGEIRGGVLLVHGLTDAPYSMRRLAEIRELPPMLTSLSIVDATVLTPATAREFYDRLGENGSELVVFDVNRSSDLRPYIRGVDERLLAELFPPRPRSWQLTVVTNSHPDTAEVVARVFPAGSGSGSFAESPLSKAHRRHALTLSTSPDEERGPSLLD